MGISAAKYRQLRKVRVDREWYFAAEIPTPLYPPAYSLMSCW